MVDLWTKILLVADFIGLDTICDRNVVSICCFLKIVGVVGVHCSLYNVHSSPRLNIDEPLHDKIHYVVVILTESPNQTRLLELSYVHSTVFK